MQQSFHKLPRVFCGILTLALLPGCSTVKQYFSAGEKANLAPFAEQTIEMLSTVEFPLTQDNSVLIRKYLGPDMPGMADLDEKLAKADWITEQIMEYAVELVQISEHLLVFVDILNTRKQNILEGLGLLHAARKGDAEAKRRLSGDEFILVAEHRPSAQAGEEELVKAEAYLMERLTTMKRINDEMMPEVEL